MAGGKLDGRKKSIFTSDSRHSASNGKRWFSSGSLDCCSKIKLSAVTKNIHNLISKISYHFKWWLKKKIIWSQSVYVCDVRSYRSANLILPLVRLIITIIRSAITNKQYYCYKREYSVASFAAGWPFAPPALVKNGPVSNYSYGPVSYYIVRGAVNIIRGNM